MATFPAYACVLLDGYEESPDYNVLRSPMDNAIAKQRPRRSLPIVLRSVRIKVENKSQKINFDNWFKNDINGGTSFFDYTDPLDGSVKQARFVDGNISWTTPGNVWFADAQIETIG